MMFKSCLALLFAVSITAILADEGNKPNVSAPKEPAAALLPDEADMFKGPSIDNPAALPAKTKVEEVIVVFKQHYDLGFWGMLKGGKGFTRPVTAKTMVDTFKGYHLDQAFATFEKTKNQPEGKRFVWAVPGWVMTQLLDQPAERRNRVVELIKRRQLDLLANPFTTETESMDVEDFVRGLGFSSRIARDLGMPLPAVINMTDVPEHSWACATIAHHAGIKLFRTGCNPCSSSPDIPRLSWWEGPDGSRILHLNNPVSYGSDLLPPKDWNQKAWLWMVMAGDNCGSHNAGQVNAALARGAKQMPGVRVRTGTMEDFANAILAENPDLPILKQDLADTWIHGIMAMPVEVGIARNVRPRIIALETLDTLLAAWENEKPTAATTIAKAYEKSLLFSEHTWGSWLGYAQNSNLKDGKTAWRYGSEFTKAWDAGLYQQIEDTYQEHGDYIRAAQSLVEPALADRLSALAKAVNVPGKRVVVFNPLPWVRDAVVETPVTSTLPGTALTLRDTASGKTIPAVSDGKTLRFLAPAVPSLGYRTFTVEAAAASDTTDLKIDAAAGILENRFLRVTLDPKRGTIASIVDKQTNRELVDAKSPYGFGQYLYERFTEEECQAYKKNYAIHKNSIALCKQQVPAAAVQPHVAASPENFIMTTDANPLSVSATMTAKPSGPIDHAVALKVVLHRDTPSLDLEWSIAGKRPDLHPEGGWLCLPANVQNPRFRLARMGGVVDPSRDIGRKSNLDIFCLDGGLTLQGDDQAGLGLCPLDSPLVSIGYPGLLRFSTDWTPRQPVVFLNLFNNSWGCNYRQWIDGSWTSRVRVWAVQGQDLESTLMTPSRETRAPCLVAMIDAPAGRQPAVQSGLCLSRKGVQVTAFGQNPDGDGTLLRVWEQAGNSGELIVTGLKAKTATPVNLRGELSGSPIPIQSGKLTFDLPAYAPSSFVLQ